MEARLTEKKDKDKRFVYNWSPISLLNIDLEILFKALADCIKKYLPFLILSNQRAYVEGRFISEGGRLLLDILQVTDFLKLKELPVNIQKAFDSFNHLLSCLKNSACVKHFLSGYKYY